MTPINPAAAGGLPEYARQDVVGSGVGTAPRDASYSQSIDPSVAGYVDPYADPYADQYVQSYADQYATQYADPYAAPYEAYASDPYGSAVAGTQPAVTGGGPTATLEDFAALGIFTDDELVQLALLNASPQELGALYQESLAFMQTPEFAQWQAEQQAIADGSAAGTAPAGDVAVAGQPATAAAAAGATGEPGWNKQWEQKFRDLMQEQGLDSKTQMMVLASLRQAPLAEADLQQAFEYYSTNEAGKEELRVANEQVLAGNAQQARSMLAFGAGALAIGGVGAAIANSKGNLVRALTRVANGSGENAAIAARALDEIKAGRALAPNIRTDAMNALRQEAGATSRLRHPISKVQLNGAARHLTPATKLSFKDAMRYGLWMQRGDAAANATTGAANASRDARAAGTVAGGGDDAVRTAAGAGDDAVRAVAGAGDDAVRAVAGAGDDVARAATSGAAQAAKGAGLLGKVGKALGPVGLALSAGVGIWGISKTMEAEGGFGKESAKMTGNVAGGLAGGVAGAAAGAAIGSVVPVIGTGIGAVVGGIVGGIGIGAIGEKVGGFLHDIFD